MNNPFRPFLGIKLLTLPLPPPLINGIEPNLISVNLLARKKIMKPYVDISAVSVSVPVIILSDISLRIHEKVPVSIFYIRLFSTVFTCEQCDIYN